MNNVDKERFEPSRAETGERASIRSEDLGAKATAPHEGAADR